MRRAFPFVLFLCLGICVAHAPMLLSAFEQIQSDPGDSRFNNFVLEYSYQFLLGNPYANSFWDMPLFYPARNVTAYSDLLLGIAPPYWLLRGIGLSPLTSFQLWLIALSVLNFCCAFLLFRRTFSLSYLPALIGAFVFSFAGVRLARLSHQQMYAQFFVVLIVMAAFAVYREAKSDQRSAGRIAWLAMCVLLVLQLYSGFYHGWFTVLLLLVSAGCLFPLRDARERLIAWLRSDWWWIGGVIAFSTFSLYPLATHYLQTAELVGLREISTVQQYLPTLASWVYAGKESYLYGWMAPWLGFEEHAHQHEHALFVGIVTIGLALTGLWFQRHKGVVRFVCAVGLCLCLISTFFPSGTSLWSYVFTYLPGAGAIRAVTRIGAYLLIPVAFGVALWAERYRVGKGRPSLAVICLLLLCVVEQVRFLPSFSKSQTLANEQKLIDAVTNHPKKCKAFYFAQVNGRFPAWRYQLDAMWVSMRTGFPTVNGHSGNQPPGWTLGEARIGSKRQDELLARELLSWADVSGLNHKEICWVKRYKQKGPSTSARPCCKSTTYFGGEREDYALRE